MEEFSTINCSFIVLGIEHFEGRYIHSWDYHSAEDLQGKQVLVIGIGNSGGDLAVDISRVAEKVHNSSFFFNCRGVSLSLTVFFKSNVMHDTGCNESGTYYMLA